MLRIKLEDELRSLAMKGKPLTPDKLEKLTKRLTQRPKLKINSNIPDGKYEGNESRSASRISSSSSSSEATRHFANDAERFLKRCSSAIGSFIEACGKGLCEDDTMMEHQRLLLRDTLSSLDASKVLARGESLLRDPGHSVKSQAKLERICHQLKEMAVVLGRLTSTLDESSSWLTVSEKADDIMRSVSGNFINKNVLRTYHCEYMGFAEKNGKENYDMRRLLGSMRKRFLNKAITLGSGWSDDQIGDLETEDVPMPSISLSQDQPLRDPEGVAFTDSVLERLRSRLAAISVDNGRNPNFSIEEYIVLESTESAFFETSSNDNHDVPHPAIVEPLDESEELDAGAKNATEPDSSETNSRTNNATACVADSKAIALPSSSEIYNDIAEIAESTSVSNDVDLQLDTEEFSLASHTSSVSIKDRLRARLAQRQ